MSNKLTRMAQDILAIERDLPYRFEHTGERVLVDDFDVICFDQTWGDTTLGFGGVGGQAVTTATTYVFIPLCVDQPCFVYFGSRFAYTADFNVAFRKDLSCRNMRSVARSGIYRDDAGRR